MVIIKHCNALALTTNEMGESYAEAKAVLDNVKSSAWRFFKLCVFGEDISDFCLLGEKKLSWKFTIF